MTQQEYLKSKQQNTCTVCTVPVHPLVLDIALPTPFCLIYILNRRKCKACISKFLLILFHCQESLKRFIPDVRNRVYISVFEILKTLRFLHTFNRSGSGSFFQHPFQIIKKKRNSQSRSDYQHYVKLSWQSGQRFLRYNRTNTHTHTHTQLDIHSLK